MTPLRQFAAAGLCALLLLTATACSGMGSATWKGEVHKDQPKPQ